MLLNFTTSVRLAALFFWRDRHLPEVRALFTILVLAVACVSSVGFFVDRLVKGLNQETHQMLGADWLLSNNQVLSEQWSKAAHERGLNTANTTLFAGMVLYGERMQLASVKAVSEGYPLRGQLRITASHGDIDQPVQGIPSKGTVWLDSALARALDIQPGTMLQLGDTSLRFEKIIVLEPDRELNFLSFAPRLMLNQSDLPATGLLRSGSRAEYRLLVAGQSKDLADFDRYIRQQPQSLGRIVRPGEGESSTQETLNRTRQFFNLAACLSVILSAIGVALVTRRQVNRRLDGYALLRSLGCQRSRLLGLVVIEFVSLALLASLIGLLVGWLGQLVLDYLLSALFDRQLPPPSLWAAGVGVGVALVLLLGFSLPTLWSVVKVSPMQVIRHKTSTTIPIIQYVWGGILLIGLMMVQAGDISTGLIVAGGFTLALLFAWLFVAGVLYLIAGLPWSGFIWRHAALSLKRYRQTVLMQTVALGLGIGALLILILLTREVQNEWQKNLPPDTPNHFLFNVLTEQRETLDQQFQESALAKPEWSPMMNSRLLAINGVTLTKDTFSDIRAKRMAERDFRLSWRSSLPPGNSIVAGQWFTNEQLRAPGLSLEMRLASTLGVKVGDRLTFDIDGTPVEAPILNLRQVDWGLMRVNFFVLTTPAQLQSSPTISWMTAFRLPPDTKVQPHSWVLQMPNLSVVDMSVILRQIRSVLEQATWAVQFIFIFTLAIGLLVLYATLLVTQDERRQSSALLRVLGASTTQLDGASKVELFLSGALAGLLGVAIAWSLGGFIAARLFQIILIPSVLSIVLAILGGILLNLLVGKNMLRSIIRTSPLRVFKTI